MKESIHYCLEFFSKWHCSSGLAAGANADALVVRDGDGLPYVPGKTIKGLIRQAVEELAYFQGVQPDIPKLFGNVDSLEQAETFFSDAMLEDHDEIVSDRLGRYLFSYISQTRLSPDGTAEKGSLRRTEVVVPCKLRGFIMNVEQSQKQLIINAFPYIKAIGLHRSRGLGRCRITFIAED